jgi:hypothetical protein
MLYGRNLVPFGSQIGGCFHIQTSPALLIVFRIAPSRSSSERPGHIKTDDLSHRMGSIAGTMSATAARHGSGKIPTIVAA